MPVQYRHANSQVTTQPAPEREQETQDTPRRRPIFQRDKFDGVDSDDESTDSENEIQLNDPEDLEDQPQVVGEIEIDMEQEEEDFLKFSRDALGIDDEAWARIISDRQQRGGTHFLHSLEFKTDFNIKISIHTPRSGF